MVKPVRHWRINVENSKTPSEKIENKNLLGKMNEKKISKIRPETSNIGHLFKKNVSEA